MISNKIKDIQYNKKEEKDNTPLSFEETVKRLLQTPPKKQSEIKGKKKDISK